MPLKIRIPESTDLWDEENGRFITVPAQTIELEHSLAAISKWEGKWKKAFFSYDEKTPEETMDYIKCMAVSDVDPVVFSLLTPQMAEDIAKYIGDAMVATTFSQINQPTSNEKITAEILYYDMIACGVPLECENWHVNKLIALLRVCSIKNGDGKKMTKAENGVYQRQLNERRLAAAKKKR